VRGTGNRVSLFWVLKKEQAMIYGRSTKQIEEDGLCELHTHVCKDLNAVVNGRCLYTGIKRAKLNHLRVQVERAILAGDVADLRRFLKAHAIAL
jgi:hypothetical protein